MSLTFTPVFAVQSLSSLVAGTTLVAAIFDKSQFSHNFMPSPAGNYDSNTSAFTWPTSWNGIAVASGNAASTVFPIVNTISVVTATDAGGVESIGQVRLGLKPASGDVVLPASVMNYVLDPQAVVLTVSGTFGTTFGG